VQRAVSPVIRSWCKGPVGSEKHFPAKFAKIKSRQDALQTPFAVFLGRITLFGGLFGLFAL
jgi:hypothetical protein